MGRELARLKCASEDSQRGCGGDAPVSFGRKLSPVDLSKAVTLVAPGTPLRDAIDSIIRAENGALIVVASPKRLGEQLISGGIELECEFAPMRLYELAKMDGAIIVAPDMSTIYYANVQLTPDPSLPSQETGMRHLAAHRTAQQSGALIIAVSERRKVVTLYLGNNRPYILEDIRVVLDKAVSALTTLEKFTRRLREEARLLSIHEYDGTVTLREVAGVVSMFEYTVRIAEEVEQYIEGLGQEGRLVGMQLEQEFHRVPKPYEALLRDYISDDISYEEARKRLGELTLQQLSEPIEITQPLGYGQIEEPGSIFLEPRGYRQLERVPRLRGKLAQRLVEEFGSLKQLMEATEEELDEVEGVSRGRARDIHQNLRRKKEQDRSAEGVV
jgi:diadenylate cyclase